MKEKKLIFIYTVLILLLSIILRVIYFEAPHLPIINRYYSPSLHIILEGTTTFLIFLIFLRSAQLHFKTGDKRMAIISAAFFFGTFLNLFHVITARSFPYDILTVSNLQKQPELFYLFVEKLILVSSFFISVFYSAKFYNIKTNFIKKPFVAYLGILLSALIFHEVILPLFPAAYSKIYLLRVDNFRIVDEIFYFLAAFIYIGIENPKHKRLLMIFITGLFIVGAGELFYSNPAHSTTEGVIAHITKIIGFLLILSGLGALENNPEIVSLKQKLAGYLSLLLVFAYMVFTSLTLALLGIRFPEYFNFIFYEFILIFTVFQYAASSKFIQPIVNIINTIDKFKPDEKLQDIAVSSDDEIGVLTAKLNTILDYNREYLLDIKKALANEKTLRQIFIKVRDMEEHDQIYNYLLEQLSDLFNADRCLHLHYCDNNSNLFVKNEKIGNKSFQPLLERIIVSSEHAKEFVNTELICINNVNKEIACPELREFLINNGINAFLSYPTQRKRISRQESECLGFTLICFAAPKKCSEDEVEYFKLFIDTVSVIYLEIKQRQEKEDVKKIFVATLTHDLKSPIIAEQKALEFLIPKTKDLLSETYQEYLADIYKTNENLLKLVNNLQSVYHYELGNPALNKTDANIKEVIENSIRPLKYLAEDKKSHISTEIQDDLPLINIDKDEIGRVVSNLAGNAIRHTREGTEIKITAIKNNNDIQVSVHDNGEGIIKDRISAIFQRFPTEKRKIGSGLGLYLSKQIITAHKGKIWCETYENIGTTFYFTLPL